MNCDLDFVGNKVINDKKEIYEEKSYDYDNIAWTFLFEIDLRITAELEWIGKV